MALERGAAPGGMLSQVSQFKDVYQGIYELGETAAPHCCELSCTFSARGCPNPKPQRWMPAPRRVLLCLEDSDAAEDAVKWAAEHVLKRGDELHLVRV